MWSRKSLGKEAKIMARVIVEIVAPDGASDSEKQEAVDKLTDILTGCLVHYEGNKDWERAWIAPSNN